MTVANTLVAQKSKNEMVYMANGAEVKLSPETVKKYLVSGDAQNVTTQEIVMFMNICKFNGLNPWLKEAYCVKYGNAPATMVTGRTAYEKRAEDNPNFDGSVAGIIVEKEDGSTEYRKGASLRKNEVLVGGFAEVWRKDRTHSTYVEVSFEEYAGRKKDGSFNGQWMSKPATMIRKVALVQALREAFPKSMYDGLSSPEEVQEVDATVINEQPPVQYTEPQLQEEPEQPAQQPTQPPVQRDASEDINSILFG